MGILINNAGYGLQGTFLEQSINDALGMVQLDIASLTAQTHVFTQDVRGRKRGQILLVSSLLDYQGVERFAVYAAAKAYVLHFGEALHRELKRAGITINNPLPGNVGHGLRGSSAAAGHADVEANHDETRAGGARRDSRPKTRPDEHRAGCP